MCQQQIQTVKSVLIHLTTTSGWTAVFVAAETCCNALSSKKSVVMLGPHFRELLELLVQFKADLNVMDISGHTPLSMAVGCLHTFTTHLLHKYGN